MRSETTLFPKPVGIGGQGGGRQFVPSRVTLTFFIKSPIERNQFQAMVTSAQRTLKFKDYQFDFTIVNSGRWIRIYGESRQ